MHCTASDNNPNNKPALCQFKLRLKRKYNNTLDFMFARINMFSALTRLILVRGVRRG